MPKPRTAKITPEREHPTPTQNRPMLTSKRGNNAPDLKQAPADSPVAGAYIAFPTAIDILKTTRTEFNRLITQGHITPHRTSHKETVYELHEIHNAKRHVQPTPQSDIIKKDDNAPRKTDN